MCPVCRGCVVAHCCVQVLSGDSAWVTCVSPWVRGPFEVSVHCAVVALLLTVVSRTGDAAVTRVFP